MPYGSGWKALGAFLAPFGLEGEKTAQAIRESAAQTQNLKQESQRRLAEAVSGGFATPDQVAEARTWEGATDPTGAFRSDLGMTAAERAAAEHNRQMIAHQEQVLAETHRANVAEEGYKSADIQMRQKIQDNLTQENIFKDRMTLAGSYMDSMQYTTTQIRMLQTELDRINIQRASGGISDAEVKKQTENINAQIRYYRETAPKVVERTYRGLGYKIPGADSSEIDTIINVAPPEGAGLTQTPEENAKAARERMKNFSTLPQRAQTTGTRGGLRD
jgi:hypothetical protein